MIFWSTAAFQTQITLDTADPTLDFDASEQLHKVLSMY